MKKLLLIAVVIGMAGGGCGYKNPAEAKKQTEGAKPVIEAAAEGKENIDYDRLVGWYKLPERHYRTRAIMPGPGTLIPVFKREGNYYSACRGFEVPLKKNAQGLEWGLTKSSMVSTMIGYDNMHRYYIIINDKNAQYEGEMSTWGEKQGMMKVDEPKLRGSESKAPRVKR